MSFNISINDLIGAEGARSKVLRCKGYSVHEGWRFERGKNEIYKSNKEPQDKSSREWKDWTPKKDWSWIEASLTPAWPPPAQTVSSSAPSITVMVIRTEKMPKASDELDAKEDFKKVDQAAQDTAINLKDFVSNELNFPTHGLVSYLRDQAQYAFMPTQASSNSAAFEFAYFSDPSMSWTWAYAPAIREIRAILICREYEGEEGRRKEEDRSTGCRAILQLQAKFIDQPLLPAFLCIQFMSSRMIELIAIQAIPDLLEIERQTANSAWDPGSDKMLKRLRPNKILNFSTLSEDITILSQLITDIRFRLDNLISYVPVVRRYNNKLRKKIHKDDDEFQSHQKILDESLQAFGDFLLVRKKKADSLAERINTQVIAVNSQRAQQMAQDSHKLAKESKRDSSSMMTIAAVTMVFLPGTFVAALFAMPLFQWDAVNGQVIDQRFWWYWVITVPLTLAVLGFWLWYIKKKYKNEKEEDKMDPQLGDLNT